jgi:hypothetical protein
MREYDSSPGRTILLPVLIGVIITASVVSGAYYFANMPTIPTTSTTTSPTTSMTTSPTSTTTEPTTTTSVPVKTYGALAADYLDSRRDDVVFFWHYNNSFVNQNLSAYYDSQHTGAYVDGLYMLNEIEPMVRLLFHPYHENIRGEGNISQLEWETLGGQLIDDGIRQMPNSDTTADLWPPDYMVEVCFEDGTSFHISYLKSAGLVYVANGTWSGFDEYGWAMSTFDYENGWWLQEAGHLQAYLTTLFDTITTHVSYPE